MTKTFAGALLGAGLLAATAMQAQAQIQFNAIQTQVFPFSGTCTGANQIIGTPAISLVNATSSATAGSATITIADIVVVGLPSGSLQYANLAISGDAGTLLVWLGPGQTHVTTTVGSAGNSPETFSPTTNLTTPSTTQAVGNGVFLPSGGGLNLTLACTTGSWNAYATIWYHTP
jgi:hypothetical protein